MQQPWQTDNYERIAGPLLHPSDTHLTGRSLYLHGGDLLRHERTGRYVLSCSGSLRSVPQEWARGIHAERT